MGSGVQNQSRPVRKARRTSLRQRTLWSIGATFLVLVAGLYLADHLLVPRGVFYLGCIAIVIGSLSLFSARRLRGSTSHMLWVTHARLLAGLAIYVAAVFILQQRMVAFALLPLLTVITPCYLYTWRFALPYTAAPALIVCVGLLTVDGPSRVAHALISTCAVLVMGAAMIITKHRTKLLADRNRRLAYADPLTGIANMRSLRERISADLGRPGGDGHLFALFAIDLDNFKEVNDRFDHSTGDRVLCGVSAALTEELEPGDLASRRGGDEFAVLVANPSQRDLEELRGRLERAIARARVATCPQVTPSGTVAYIRTRPGEEIGAVMERADQALHDAKVASRERPRSETRAFTETRNGVEAGRRAKSGGGELSQSPAQDSSFARATPTLGLLRRGAHALGRCNPDWTFAALLLALGPVATVSVSVARMVEPFSPAAGIATGVAALALPVGCVWAGISGVSPRWLHLPWLAAYALLGLEIALAGPSGTALLDLIPAIVMYGFLVFKPRTAVLYLLLGQGMYGAIAISGGFAHAVGRTIITTVVVAVVGGLVAKLRLVTIRFARTNRELSERDALTGIGNLRALRERVVHVIERASSGQLHPVLVAIDLDEFKQVNDVHSHSTGDRVLVAVARAVSERVRLDELVARRGGDEFAVVIDDADAEYADVVVRRIADAIARTRSRICPDLRSTASVAYVPWQSGQTPDDLLHAADVALHARKAESRASRDPLPPRRGGSRKPLGATGFEPAASRV